MDLSRVVEILQDGKSQGSGYLIGPSLVLTARHVCKPGVIGKECFVHALREAGDQAISSAKESRPQPMRAKVGWLAEEHDFALIEIVGDQPRSPATELLPLGEVPVDGAAHPIIGCGFPAAAGTDQRTITGKVTWVLTGNRFDIDVDSAIPRDWTKWAGFSGSAIFADGLLVGIVRTVRESWGGGVLHATPAAWLLEDAGFTAFLERQRIPLPDRVAVGAVDPSMPLDLEAGQPTDGPRRFLPSNPRIPFVGREDVLALLDDFVTSTQKRPFAWWLVTGSGGAGKTRLARELCLRMRRKGWRAGFLPRGFVADISDLEAWSPRTKTLIIADYPMENIEELRKLVARLARRDRMFSLRLLLLEREAGELFKQKFIGTDRDGGEIEVTRYRPEPLALSKSELKGHEIWGLVETCPWLADTPRVPLGRDEFFQRLDKLDVERRPLVAMILAEALGTSSGGGGFGGLEELLRYVLERERNDLWPKELKADNTKIGTIDADVAIAFATMADGLGLPELDAIEAARGKPLDDKILDACAVAIGKPVMPGPRLGRLEPDLIGEFFVLETLRSDPKSFVKPPRWMPQTAWHANGNGMFFFVVRAKQNFATHPAIPQIDITVEGVRESWILASFNMLSRANELVKGFDNVSAWLHEQAPSNVSAALAFAQINERRTSLEHISIDARTLIALADSLRALHQAHANEVLHEWIANSLFNTGVRLDKLGRGEDAIAVYDDLVARFGAASELPPRQRVADALFNKGGALRELGRNEEKIAVFDDLIARFGGASELPLREQAAKTLRNKGRTLVALGRSEEAVIVYDDLIARFGAASELPLQEQVAVALFDKGVTLGRSADAVAVYDDLIARFGGASELPLREWVAKALFNKGGVLRALDPGEDAIAVYDDLIARFGTSHELPLREEVAMALRNKGRTFAELGRSEEEVAVYDDLVIRFATANELPLREQVAIALFSKGGTLSFLGRSEEAITVYDELLARFGTANELPLREQVANGLINKAGVLSLLGRREDAFAVYDELLANFGAATELALRQRVAQGLLNKVATLRELGLNEEEIAVYDDLIARFGEASELSLREEIAKALANKGVTLRTLGRSEEEIAVYDDLIARFGKASELSLREEVANALVNKGVRVGALGRREDAIAVYDDLIARFGEASELPLRKPLAKALFNKGVTIGLSVDAVAVYDDLIARFGTASELPLREPVANALVNKGFTLSALGRSEDAVAVYDDLVVRFSASNELSLRMQVANGIINKAVTLGALGRREEELATYHNLLGRYQTATEEPLKELVGKVVLQIIQLELWKLGLGRS